VSTIPVKKPSKTPRKTAKSILEECKDRVEKYGINGVEFPYNEVENIAYCPRGLIAAVCNETHFERAIFDPPKNQFGLKAAELLDKATGKENKLSVGAAAELYIQRIPDRQDKQKKAGLELIEKALELVFDFPDRNGNK